MYQSGSHAIISGDPCKIIQDRITLVERHFGEICQSVGGYVRTLAKLRNKGDQISRSVQTYAQNETHNPHTQAALKEYVGHLSSVEDYRNAEIKRLEVKVVNPLTVYGKSCKQAKERIRNAFAALDREGKQRKTLDRLMERNPRNTYQITLAQNELQKLAIDASRASHDLEQEMDAFERKKLEDIKQVMSEFVSIQLAFHSKALQFYSQCYHSLTTVREDADLEEFRNSIRPLATQTRQDLQQQMNIPSGSVGKRTEAPSSSHFVVSATGGKPKAKLDVANRDSTLNSTNPSSMYSHSTGQDDDEDDEDEEEDSEDENEDDDDDDDDDDTELTSQRGIQKQMGKPQVTPRKW